MIRIRNPRTQPVDLTVYDLLGRAVATLLHGEQPLGDRTVQFTVPSAASGIYFAVLTAGPERLIHKLTMIR